MKNLANFVLEGRRKKEETVDIEDVSGKKPDTYGNASVDWSVDEPEEDDVTDTIDLNSDDNTESTEDLIDKEPSVIYDDESNTVEVAIEAEQYFEMKVIDISGTVVFTCPVLMVDGTPTNYQLPELPAGIYTLKVESPEVTYEGIFDVK